MKYYLGIDLGSTTSKAIMTQENGHIVGRGITNTRANYQIAADIARLGAEYDTRFFLLRKSLIEENGKSPELRQQLDRIETAFRYLRFSRRFDRLTKNMLNLAKQRAKRTRRSNIVHRLPRMFSDIRNEIEDEFFSVTISSTSRFFRDIFSYHYLKKIESLDPETFDSLLALYDASIIPVENEMLQFDFADLVINSLEFLNGHGGIEPDNFFKHVEACSSADLTPANYVGTGYGRQLLPFDEKHIKSEILCHAFGAHALFPGTRTVLDIGGQDTKAIQVDEHGLVTSFQMNDRCAAGCGRYLGYIADELSMSVSELGPLALQSDYETNICSTCTVFAGAELREYLNIGEKKENILAGLHKAIVLRAFSLVARSGGVRNEFTFTGGVARNQAVVSYVSRMVKENYGSLTINIHPDSIFMGALGAALLGKHDIRT